MKRINLLAAGLAVVLLGAATAGRERAKQPAGPPVRFNTALLEPASMTA